MVQLPNIALDVNTSGVISLFASILLVKVFCLTGMYKKAPRIQLC